MSGKVEQGTVASVKPFDNEQVGSELKDEQLDEASGGMLLPAVQKVREAAARPAILIGMLVPAVQKVR